MQEANSITQALTHERVKTFHLINKIQDTYDEISYILSDVSHQETQFHVPSADSQQVPPRHLRRTASTFIPEKYEIPSSIRTLIKNMRQKQIPDKHIKQPLQCKICYSAEVSIAFVPCGHAGTCSRCSETLNSCPYCKRPIQGRLRIYVP